MDVRDKLVEIVERASVRTLPKNTCHTNIAMLVNALIEEGVTVQEWKPISEPPKETGHYLVNIHQEDDETGEEDDFVLDAWYEVNGLLFVPKTAGWTLLNEWYDLTAQMLPFVTHWMERPQPPKGE